MRLYRLRLYVDMEKDFAGFDIESGASIRQGLKEENERYVKRMAPEKYWDHLIPKHEIGCKRKVMDTDYLSTLHKPNVELIATDPVERITESGVVTRSGKEVKADAIILATGFEVFRMLFPMEIIGQDNITLNEYWDTHHQGAAQAYLGTCVPGFPSFFTLMGPNTVTGHNSVIYSVECQINMTLRLLDPILKTAHQSGSRVLPAPQVSSVSVKFDAAREDSSWMQEKLGKLVWASGCTSWALDPKTGMNIAMYPQYQFLFWLRSVFLPGKDFEYVDARNGTKGSLVVGGWKSVQRFVRTAVVVGMLAGAALAVRRAGGLKGVKALLRGALRDSLQLSRGLLKAR